MLPLNVLKDVIAESALSTSKNKVFSAKKRDRSNILGTLTLKLKYRNKETIVNAYVSGDIDIPLLNIKSCQNLNLVIRIHAINTDVDWFEENFTLFKGLGHMEGQYKIEIRENAIPYAIFAPRAVSVTLEAQVKEALDDM
ncbi:hypothetical protein JTB14_037994 [Gonioctena quinquepunctata]|nr:hypothetical protein JTB14_037994 [Gonioctena quinquepunctata]